MRTYSDTQAGAEVLRIGHFLSRNAQLWIGFQPFVYHRCVTKYPINTTIFQVDKGILITVIGDSFHFRVLILNIFLVRGAVFHPNTFAFQIGKRFVGIFFGNHDG